MKRVSFFIIIIVSIQLFALSCGNNKEEEKESYKFYYYPRKNVYYNLEKKIFLYSINGGKTWDSVINTSDDDPKTLGEKVAIRSPVKEVYKKNETHRNLYKGKLFNIIGVETVVASAVPEVAERKVQRPRTKEVNPFAEEDKVIEGIKNFVNKILGKHKKKQEEE